MIVCPTHHAVIHAINAVFDRGKKSFIGPDDGSSILQLVTNHHL